MQQFQIFSREMTNKWRPFAILTKRHNYPPPPKVLHTILVLEYANSHCDRIFIQAIKYLILWTINPASFKSNENRLAKPRGCHRSQNQHFN